ncbi:hypothetical protein SZ55_0196 [Pseudomonas sp. FeS53a]|uniref:hypothetical protein n=1 Tax=Pseudomonas sp. FeS53a TaxID=1604022 RepID=UPI0005C8668A|nr:hypothetical protein [Pseudomonas sp. FeS53a]KIV75610.1 hypothetical protein SZ55_0196 [Pseudomonas sp. FeS53a]
MNQDPDLHHLADQPAPRPAPDLAARIVAHATAQPQRLPWHLRLRRALAHWQPGWQASLASLVLCGLLGLLGGHLASPPADNDLALAAQAVDQLLWTDEP